MWRCYDYIWYMCIFVIIDLRDERGYLADHMGSNIITSSQARIVSLTSSLNLLFGYYVGLYCKRVAQ